MTIIVLKYILKFYISPEKHYQQKQLFPSPTPAPNTKSVFDLFKTLSIANICDIKSIGLVYLLII